MSRRERQRLATYEEIVSTARDLLRGGDEVSVRAVATAMGLTAPALYRYVDGHAGLLELLTRQIFADVVADMEQARDRYPEDDPAARIVASTTAFRRWALRHPPEFRLVFATPPGASSDVRTKASMSLPGFPALENCSVTPGTELFSDFFGALFLGLWRRLPFEVPAVSELDPAFVDYLSGGPATGRENQLLEALGEQGPGMLWVFKFAWARLYGTVAIEVFGHLDPVLIDAGTMFSAMMVETGRTLGLEGEWPRLREVALVEASR